MQQLICAFTSICEEDTVWLNQYLSEVERLRLPFAMHFDKCSEKTKRRVMRHKYFQYATELDDKNVEFNETHKQGLMNWLMKSKYDWALAWDMDETWEKDFRKKLFILDDIFDAYVCPCPHLWDNGETIRRDGIFQASAKVKFHNVRNRKWEFYHPIINGPRLLKKKEEIEKIDIVCVHHGLKTKELRDMHKERWDRIYSTALRGDKNPYGFWSYACDESITPITIPRPKNL